MGCCCAWELWFEWTFALKVHLQNRLENDVQVKVEVRTTKIKQRIAARYLNINKHLNVDILMVFHPEIK